MKTISPETVQQFRAQTFRTAPHLRLSTPQQAINFVNERGFVFFWPVKGVLMPSLWGAVAGDRPVPDEHDDPGHVTWGWKDTLLDKRAWYYARVLKKRNTIISMHTLPYFYALSPNYGDPQEEIEEQYRQGMIPLEVRLVFETLLEKGPLDTLSLRRESHLSGANSNAAFNRALDHLQKELKVLPVGVSDAGTWHYAFIYDLTHRYYPDLLSKAREITEPQAREHILTCYIRSLGLATLKDVSSLFKWDTNLTQKVVSKLVEARVISDDVELQGPSENMIALKALT
jgi:hypothetical protein